MGNRTNRISLMNTPKSPELFKRLVKRPSPQNIGVYNESRDLPVCIHAHKTPLPLLADFPKKRIDINPHLDNCKYLQNYDWSSRQIDASRIVRDITQSGKEPSHVAIFLDSFTIGNANTTNLSGIDLPIYLFLGDTQHGPAPGFMSLIELAGTRNIERIIATNNPQHLRFLKSAGISESKLFFCPLGIANSSMDVAMHTKAIENQMNRTKDFLAQSITFVGSITDHHLRRRRITNHLSAKGLCGTIKTLNYKDAAAIHALSKASLNISLNSDINFRFSEVLGSGGLLITDYLPPPQKMYVQDFFGTAGILYYKSLIDLMELIERDGFANQIRNAQSSESRMAENMLKGVRLDSLEELNEYLVEYKEDKRDSIEKCIRQQFSKNIACHELSLRVSKYASWRDQAIALGEISDNTSITYPSHECPLTLLDICDLPFSQIKVTSSNRSHRFIASELTRLGWSNIIINDA
jgi:hypothetical protein